MGILPPVSLLVVQPSDSTSHYILWPEATMREQKGLGSYNINKVHMFSRVMRAPNQTIKSSFLGDKAGNYVRAEESVHVNVAIVKCWIEKHLNLILASVLRI